MTLYNSALELFMPEFSYYQENITTASLRKDSLHGSGQSQDEFDKVNITIIRWKNNIIFKMALIPNLLDCSPFMMITGNKKCW